MRLSINLLGRPSIIARTEAGDERRALAGQKPWGLLAYLLLTGGATRRDITDRLWPEAEDPLAAARWTILQVRRALEPWATLVERDGRLVIEAGADDLLIEVDAAAVLDGRFDPATIDGLVGGDLLEGMTYPDAPEFEDWLLVQRARLTSAAGAALRWAAVVSARTEPDRAIALVDRVLSLDPYDDAAHELGIRIEIDRGAARLAEARLAAAERRYRDDLGVDPPSTLRRPLDRTTESTDVPIAAAARAILDLARARHDAGDYEAAIDAAGRAASIAAATGDERLQAESLLVYAGVLIHAIRGRDREAVGLLDQALALATAVADERLIVEIERELGYVAFLAAHYGAAESLLMRSMARAEAIGDAVGAARAMTIVGACESDRAEFTAAEATLTEALTRLRTLGDRWEPYAASFLARVRLRTGRLREAGSLAWAATERSRQVGWLSLVPWPMVVAGEAQLADQDLEAAGRTFTEAHALATELGDPCWRACALRGLGLVAAREGDDASARRLLAEAAEAAGSQPDMYAWSEAIALTDLLELEGPRDPERYARALSIARRGPMPDLLDRLSAIDPGAAPGQRDRQTPAQTPRP